MVKLVYCNKLDLKLHIERYPLLIMSSYNITLNILILLLKYLLQSVICILFCQPCQCSWDVPLPRTMKVIYSSVHQEGTDPRFVKLEPVFRGSLLKCGGIQR